MDGVNAAGSPDLDGGGAVESPAGDILDVVEPPAHIWSAAVFAAVTVDADEAADLSALVATEDRETTTDGVVASELDDEGLREGDLRADADASDHDSIGDGAYPAAPDSDHWYEPEPPTGTLPHDPEWD